MGSFADGDEMEGSMGEGDESTMSGIAYENGDDEELRRQSVPAITAQHVSGSQGDPYSRTYPPAGPRTSTTGLYPPNASQTQASTSTTTSVPSSMASAPTTTASVSSIPVSGGSGVYSQAGMTESPKPLSPGIPGHETSNMGRQRSPSLTQQMQQQQFGRRQSELQSPHSGQPRPKLPGLSHPGFAAPGSAAAFPVGRGAPGSQQPGGDTGNMFAQSDPSVWAYIQTLEEKVKSLSDKVVSLDHEVVTLKKQLETRDGPAVG